MAESKGDEKEVFEFETMIVKTRFVETNLEVPTSSIRKLAAVWKHVKKGDRTVYINARPQHLSAVFDFLAGYTPMPMPRGLYQSLIGEPIDFEKRDEVAEKSMSEWVQKIQLSIFTELSKITGVPPRRTILNIVIPPEVLKQSGSFRVKLKNAINLPEMKLVTCGGYEFPKEPRTLNISGQNVLLRGPAPERPKLSMVSTKTLQQLFSERPPNS